MESNENLPRPAIKSDKKFASDAGEQMGQLMELMLQHDASDLHISVGIRPSIRIDGVLHEVADFVNVTPQVAERLIFAILTTNQKKVLEEIRQIDFSTNLEDRGRFRVNAFYQKGYLSAALRLIPTKLRTYEELELPGQIAQFAQMKQGLVLFAGPTGHGKSTTQAALIDDINRSRAEHIVTIEDPIEYAHNHKRSLVAQREVGSDVHNFADGLRAVLREDPDVVLIGEMRDPETMAAALTIAETGHLVFATIHTNDAPQTIDRIIDTFPSHQQNQVRSQLAQVLVGVVGQRLLPRIGGGRIPAVEIMIVDSAVRNLIREGKTHQIASAIQTSGEQGMVSMERALAEKIQQGLVRYEDAELFAQDSKILSKLSGRS